MTDNSKANGTNASNSVPAPVISVLPSKAGLPNDGGQVDLLVSVKVDLPAVEVDRKPLNLALVIDRSGSMSGQPLEGAKEAAKMAVSMLLPGDWVSVVLFDDRVDVLQSLVRVGYDRHHILNAIDGIAVRGSTNLFGGWAEGVSQVMACSDSNAISRVVLLSDGCANVGLVDRAEISTEVSKAAIHGATTTAMGLGRHYDEDLMRLIADAGQGNYVFLNDHNVMVTAFQNEVAGLSSLRGKKLELSVHPSGSGTLAFAVPSVAFAAGLTSTRGSVTLPNLVAGLPLDILVSLNVAAGTDGVGLTLTWDDLLTNTRQTLQHNLNLPRLGAEDWAAAPIEAKVHQERVLLELAETKQRYADAGKRRDFEQAKQELDSAFAVIQAMPPSPEREREEGELSELRMRLDNRDHEVMSKASRQFAMRRAHSMTDEKYEHMRRYEHEQRTKKLVMNQESQGARTGVTTSGSTRAPTADEVLLDIQVGRMPTVVQVVRGAVEQQHVDALVNSTSRSLMFAAGVSAALAHAGGPELQRAMYEAPQLQYGEAVFTRGFNLPAQYVIHTATQPYVDDGSAESVLKLCYNSVFQLAQRLGAKSIALPAIGTGHNMVPAEVSARAALEATNLWASKVGQFEVIRFVVLGDTVPKAFVRALGYLKTA